MLLIFCFSLLLSPESSAETLVTQVKEQGSWTKKRRRRLRKVPKKKVPVVEQQQEKRKKRRRSKSRRSDFAVYPKFTFDLSMSLGNYAGSSYTEGSLGLNTFFSQYLNFRNALFGRFISGQENIFGIDSSLRGILTGRVRGLGFKVFAGPGYRVVSKGSGASPFAEGGLILRLSFLTLGGGAKVFFLPNPPSNGAKTDTTYFLILSGGGSF